MDSTGYPISDIGKPLIGHITYIEYHSTNPYNTYTMYNLADICREVLNDIVSSYYLHNYQIFGLNGLNFDHPTAGIPNVRHDWVFGIWCVYQLTICVSLRVWWIAWSSNFSAQIFQATNWEPDSRSLQQISVSWELDSWSLHELQISLRSLQQVSANWELALSNLQWVSWYSSEESTWTPQKHQECIRTGCSVLAGVWESKINVMAISRCEILKRFQIWYSQVEKYSPLSET